MAGIDMAAWDALGQALGQPVARLLGGVPRPVRAYNSKGLGIMALPKLVNEAKQLVGEGFDAVKLRLGRPAAVDRGRAGEGDRVSDPRPRSHALGGEGGRGDIHPDDAFRGLQQCRRPRS